jgi:hypothetical protein
MAQLSCGNYPLAETTALTVVDCWHLALSGTVRSRFKRKTEGR